MIGAGAAFDGERRVWLSIMAVVGSSDRSDAKRSRARRSCVSISKHPDPSSVAAADTPLTAACFTYPFGKDRGGSLDAPDAGRR